MKVNKLLKQNVHSFIFFFFSSLSKLLNLEVSCRATNIVHDSAVACPSKTSLEWQSKEKSHQCHCCSFFLVTIPSSLDKAATTPSLPQPDNFFILLPN